MEEIEAPVFVHDGLMTMHTVGKSGGMGILTAIRTEKGAVFRVPCASCRRRCRVSIRIRRSLRTEFRTTPVGSMWRELEGVPAFESVTRNSGHPGPECGVFCPQGSSRMPTIRSDMDECKQAVMPGVLAHIVSGFLGPLNTARKDDRNSAAAGANQRHFTADGEIPRGTFAQVNSPNISGRWCSLWHATPDLPLEEGQHRHGFCTRTRSCATEESRLTVPAPEVLLPVVAHPHTWRQRE